MEHKNKQHAEQKKLKMNYQAPSLRVIELEQTDILTSSVFTTTAKQKFQTTYVREPWKVLTADDDGTIG